MVENYRDNHNQTDRFCAMITEYTNGLNKDTMGELNAAIDIENDVSILGVNYNVTEICIPVRIAICYYITSSSIYA
jgi:hypothetical protein